MRPHVDQEARDLIEDLGLAFENDTQVAAAAFTASHRAVGTPIRVPTHRPPPTITWWPASA